MPLVMKLCSSAEELARPCEDVEALQTELAEARQLLAVAEEENSRLEERMYDVINAACSTSSSSTSEADKAASSVSLVADKRGTFAAKSFVRRVSPRRQSEGGCGGGSETRPRSEGEEGEEPQRPARRGSADDAFFSWESGKHGNWRLRS